MSKFEECKSTITHYKNNKAYITLETNLYIFAEAQSSASNSFYDYTVWSWNGKDITIKEVGIHPNIE